MRQLKEYTEANFKQDYFHYAGNNNYFVNATLRRECPEFSMGNNRIRNSINVPFDKAVAKLGSPNWINQEYNWLSFWVFEFNGDKYYYMNDPHKGCTIGIYCKKKDTSKNWLFEPEEYEYQDSEEIGKKLLEFCKALSEKITGEKLQFTYNQLIPDSTVDVFYNKIKDHIEGGENYQYLINSLNKLNGGKIPDKIQDLIDGKK